MRLVSVNKEHIGKKLGHPIYNNNGIVLMPANIELTETLIG